MIINIMKKPKRLKSLKLRDFFTLAHVQNPTLYQVYIRGPYDRSLKMYLCVCYFDDSLVRYFSGDTLVKLYKLCTKV